MVATTTAAVTLEFVLPVPGFPEAKSFVLRPWGDADDSPFYLLEATDAEGIGFVVGDPFVFFNDYAPVLSDNIVGALGLTQPEDATVLVILNIADKLASSTANLLGPIVIHNETGHACQAILHDATLSTKTPLFG